MNDNITILNKKGSFVIDAIKFIKGMHEHAKVCSCCKQALQEQNKDDEAGMQPASHANTDATNIHDTRQGIGECYDFRY